MLGTFIWVIYDAGDIHVAPMSGAPNAAVVWIHVSDQLTDLKPRGRNAQIDLCKIVLNLPMRKQDDHEGKS
jgi:hypothetical protein